MCRCEDGLGGLYDYHARYYDPFLGRFISADSIVPDPGEPQSLNRYSYVYNNPAKYTDPTGHIACVDPECTVYVGHKGKVKQRAEPTPPKPKAAQDLYAPLEPSPTDPLDWLVEPLLYIWPRVKFYENGVRISRTLSDIEVECGIKEDARLLTESPFQISPSATRVDLPGGDLWLETENSGFLPGKLTLGGTSVEMRGSYRGVSVQARSVGRVAMSVTDRPGVLRVGTGVELPIVAEGENIGSVRKTPYYRVSYNIYGDRAAALAVDATVMYVLAPIVGPAVGVSPFVREWVTR